MNSFIHDYWIDKIDILKIDIEGAEKDVFEAETSWLEIVALIAIEFHDRFNSGTKRAFHQAIGDDFPDRWRKGDTRLFSR